MTYKLYQKMLEAVLTEISQEANLQLNKNSIFGKNKYGEELISLFKVSDTSKTQDLFFFTVHFSDFPTFRKSSTQQFLEILEVTSNGALSSSVVVVTGSKLNEATIDEFYNDMAMLMPGIKGKISIMTLDKLIESGLNFNQFTKNKKSKTK